MEKILLFELVFPLQRMEPCEKARPRGLCQTTYRPLTACQELQDAKWASGFLCPDELFVSQQGQRVQPQDKGAFHFSCFPVPLYVCLGVSVVKSK